MPRISRSRLALTTIFQFKLCSSRKGNWGVLRDESYFLNTYLVCVDPHSSRLRLSQHRFRHHHNAQNIRGHNSKPAFTRKGTLKPLHRHPHANFTHPKKPFSPRRGQRSQRPNLHRRRHLPHPHLHSLIHPSLPSLRKLHFRHLHQRHSLLQPHRSRRRHPLRPTLGSSTGSQ